MYKNKIMGVKEKAKQLVDKYRKYVDDGRHNGFYSSQTTWDNQKECALIAVEEIRSLMVKFHGRHINNNIGEIEYWDDVKTEIEKL